MHGIVGSRGPHSLRCCVVFKWMGHSTERAVSKTAECVARVWRGGASTRASYLLMMGNIFCLCGPLFFWCVCPCVTETCVVHQHMRYRYLTHNSMSC